MNYKKRYNELQEEVFKALKKELEICTEVTEQECPEFFTDNLIDTLVIQGNEIHALSGDDEDTPLKEYVANGDFTLYDIIRLYEEVRENNIKEPESFDIDTTREEMEFKARQDGSVR